MDTPYDLAQASEYYLTPRAQRPNAQNKYLMAKSLDKIFAYDVPKYVDLAVAEAVPFFNRYLAPAAN